MMMMMIEHSEPSYDQYPDQFIRMRGSMIMIYFPDLKGNENTLWSFEFVITGLYYITGLYGMEICNFHSIQTNTTYIINHTIYICKHNLTDHRLNSSNDTGRRMTQREKRSIDGRSKRRRAAP